MKIVAKYSHLNGEEFLIVHKRQLWREVQSVIAKVDASKCRTKRSRESRKQGQILYSPTDLNSTFKKGFEALGWNQQRRNFWVTSDERLMRRIHSLAPDEQKREIEKAGHTALSVPVRLWQPDAK